MMTIGLVGGWGAAVNVVPLLLLLLRLPPSVLVRVQQQQQQQWTTTSLDSLGFGTFCSSKAFCPSEHATTTTSVRPYRWSFSSKPSGRASLVGCYYASCRESLTRDEEETATATAAVSDDEAPKYIASSTDCSSATNTTTSIPRSLEDPSPSSEGSIHSNSTESSSILLLLSLASPHDVAPSRYSLVQQIWKWKDTVLGDGRDFFVPRIETIRALNEQLAMHLQHELQLQCSAQLSVLSNCARFDILIAITTSSTSDDLPQSLVSDIVAQYLWHQVQLTKEDQQRHQWKQWLQLARVNAGSDDPTRIFRVSTSAVSAWTSSSSSPPHDSIPTLLVQSFRVVEGPESVARYLCLVAAGLQPRNNNNNPRSQRPSLLSALPPLINDTILDVLQSSTIKFRPFSSRDAHILLQLKRTLDATPNSYQRLRDVWQVAIQAGKSCRNQQCVPAIVDLFPYASESSRTGSVGDAPPQLIHHAIQQARELVIEPAVRSYCNKWRTYETITRLKTLQDNVLQYLQVEYNPSMIDLQNARREVREVLHPYYMAIRNGEVVDTNVVVEEIRQVVINMTVQVL